MADFEEHLLKLDRQAERAHREQVRRILGEAKERHPAGLTEELSGDLLRVRLALLDKRPRDRRKAV